MSEPLCKDNSMDRRVSFKVHSCVVISAWLLLVTPAFATPNPNLINDATAACGKAIEKASEKFIDAVADAIEKCLLAWQKCDTDSELEDADACRAGLLVVNSGKCAKGKMGPTPGFVYFGPNSYGVGTDDSAISKALNKFIATLAEKCPTTGSIDFAILGITPTPTTDLELYQQLNAEPTGAACNAHKRVKLTIPARDALVTEIAVHPDGANMPLGLFAIIDIFSTCK